MHISETAISSDIHKGENMNSTRTAEVLRPKTFDDIVGQQHLFGKNGVVRDPEVHKEVIKMVNEMLPSFGFSARALTFSPVKGPKGNIEYLILLEKADKEGVITKELIDKVVKESHETLN